MSKKESTKGGLDTRTRVTWLGFILMAVIAAAGLLSFGFWPRAEGQAEVSAARKELDDKLDRHRMQPAHQVQMQVNKQFKEQLDKVSDTVQATSENVIRIGERLRVRRLIRNEEGNGD
jgi:uncharacterized protein HemX